MGYASSVFADAIGPRMASKFPYLSAEGTDSAAGDWTLSDADRFFFELESSCIFPSPAQRGPEGNYLYVAAGNEATKSELLAGRGVAISDHADQALSPEASRNMLRNSFRIRFSAGAAASGPGAWIVRNS